MHILYHSYDDMTRKISIIQLRIQSYEKEKDVLQQLINSGRESLVRMDNPNISYKTYLKEMKILDAHLLLHHDELLRLQNEKKKIDALMGQFEGTQEQVFYYRYVKGMTQEQTAEKVYLSTRQVQRIEKKIENEIMSC